MCGVAEQEPSAVAGLPAAAAPTTGGWRLVRGAAVGFTAALLALGGHVLGHGSAAPGSVVGLAAVAVVLSAVLSARRWTTGPLLAVLLGLQLVGHVALSHGGHGRLVAGYGHAGGGHAGQLTTLAFSGRTDLGMVAGHVTAAAVTALLLRRGEHWCWRLLELAGGTVRAGRLRAAGAFPGWAAPPAAISTYVVVRSTSGWRAHPHRGPPAVALAG